MFEAVRGLLGSKKFLMFLVTAAIVTIGHKIGLDSEAVAELTAIGTAAILGQGIADHGKEAAKINAANPQPPASITAVGEIKAE
jgi:hypothetical protein